jgi:hypothetical protein
MSGKHGFYSDLIVYDERNRYYYLWAQKNKPLLDDELRNMGIGLLDQVRRGIQHVYGDIASPNSMYYDQYEGLLSTAESFKVKADSVDPQSNFVVTGGSGLDKPAVLFAKGYYIFLTNDIRYKFQTYPTTNVDLNTEDKDDQKTLTPIPSISEPQTDRIDIVYVNLHFEEVTAATGTDQEVYRDSNLKNPIVGTETANRLRAVIDIRVLEDWSTDVTRNIFSESQGGVQFINYDSTPDGQPTDNDYNIPIAAIYRTAHSLTISDNQIVDLLSLYNKRILSLEEVSYRLTHGGFSPENIADHSLSGFTPDFANGIIDESAFATGLNQGLGTEAFNSNSVTPRVLSYTGMYGIQGVMIGNDPDLVTLETGPVDLNPGEVIAQQISARQVMIGYGETGVTGMRGYVDTLSVIHRGEPGKTLVSVTNFDGESGSLTLLVKGVQDGVIDNFVAVDYDGRLGVNTLTPGHAQPDEIWNTDRYNDGLRGATGVNIIAEVNGSAQVNDHLWVKKDAYVERDMFGKTWKIPGEVSRETPMLVGFSGIPQISGIADSASILIVKRGIAVFGETGVSAYGYTGGQVAYEAYNAEGTRLFTIGDIGNDFDRDIKSLYGTSVNVAYLSDKSFLLLPEPIGAIIAGDSIEYDIRLEDASHVTGIYIVPSGSDGWEGITGLVGDILYNPSFPADPAQGYTGMPYSREYQYIYYKADGTTETRTGIAVGAQIVDDPYGYTGLDGDQHGRIILKDIVSGLDPIKVEAIDKFRVSRSSYDPVDVTFTRYHYYGSGGYGGDFLNVKFAKLDLGEASDGWLINGDVYFNGNGLLNRVTFSPNALFRNDVFIYGTVYANEQIFNFANIQNLYVKNNIRCDRKGYFKEGASFGNGADVVYETLRQADGELNLYVKGRGMADETVLRGTDVSSYLMGTLSFINLKDSKVSANIGGVQGSTSNPFGLHLIDNRNVADTSKFKTFTIDFSDGRGNYSDVSLVVNGDMSIGRYFQTQYLGIGPIEEINTDYRLQVNGRVSITDVLEVKALRFIGAEAPEGSTDILNPSNISIIGRIADSANGEEYQNNQNVLREKKFTSTKRIFLDNSSGLGINAPITDPQGYYTYGIQRYYDTPADNIPTRWAFDTASYLDSQFDEIEASTDTSPNEIVVEDITIEKYKKLRCERITVANLGSLMIEWSGYVYDPSTTIPTANAIQQYYFTSPYFRNRDGGVNIDWYPENDRFGDDNFIVKVHADLIDTNATSPSIYSIDKSIGLYIPKSNWWQYATDANTDGYKSFSIFNPYENVISDFNSISFDKQNSAGSDTANWKLVLYPRLIKQNRVTVGSNLEKIYSGEWSLDLCILSEGVGKVANMVGKAYIGYYQS